MEKLSDSKLLRISIIVGLILSVVMIANTVLSTYVLYTTSFTASMSPESGESLDIAIRTDTGRPTLIESLFKQVKKWVSSYMVGSSPVDDATVALDIQITGTNVESTASVDYYVEARKSGGGGTPYRFLEGTGTIATVGGAKLEFSDARSITSHLTQMGLSTSQSHVIDYYVYVKADATGRVSGGPLTTEIVYTKFDTVTYTYDDPGTWTSALWINSGNGYAGYVRHETQSQYDANSPSGSIRFGDNGDYSCSGWICWQHTDFSNPPPSGATIKEAYIKFHSSNYWYAQNILITAYDDTYWTSTTIDNYAEWEYYWNLRTTTNVTWAVPNFAQGNFINTTDIAPVIQEIVDRGDYYPTTGRTVIFFHTLGDVASDYIEPEVFLAFKKPWMYIRWSTYSASWYPVSANLIDTPLALNLMAVIAVIITAFVIIQKERS